VKSHSEIRRTNKPLLTQAQIAFFTAHQFLSTTSLQKFFKFALG